MSKETKAKDCCYGVRPLSDCQCEKDRLAALAATPAVGGETLKTLIDRLRTLQDHYSVSGQLGHENRHIFAEAADALAAPASPLRGRKIEGSISVLLPCPFCGSANIDPEGWASTERAGPACDDCGGTADTAELWNSRPLAASKSAPVTETTHNSGEGDPSVMPDSIGADTASPSEQPAPFQPHENCNCLMCLAEKSK